MYKMPKSFRIPSLDDSDPNNGFFERYASARYFSMFLFGMFIFIVVLISILFIPSPVTDTTFERSISDPLIEVRSRFAPTPRFEGECPNGYRKTQLLDRETCSINIPVPRAVDNSLMNTSANICEAFSNYICGNTQKFEDIEDVSFGTASRSAEKMYGTVARMSADQMQSRFTSGSVPNSAHNFVLSCVYSSIRPNYDDDLQFAHETMAKIEAEGTDDYKLGFAMGAAVGLGDQAALTVNMELHPMKNRKTIMKWDIGSQLAMMPLISADQMRYVVNSGCNVLVAVGKFPFSEWIDTKACADDMMSLYHSLAKQALQIQMPSVDYDYFAHHMAEDLRTVHELGTVLESANFAHGVLDGISKILDLDKDMLAEYGIGVPDLNTIDQWTPSLDLVKLVLAKAKDAGVEKWLAYIRVMMVVCDFQYSESLLMENSMTLASRTSPSRKRVKPTMGIHGLSIEERHGWKHNTAIHGHDPVTATENISPSEEAYVRDEWEDESALVNSVLYDECSFLAMQYLPELEETYARATVSESRMKLAVDTTKRVRDAIVADIGGSSLEPSTRDLLQSRLNAIAIHEGAHWTGGSHPTLSYDIRPTDSFLKTAKNVRRRNNAQRSIELLSCQGKPASKCLSNKNTVRMSGREINAFFNPATMSITLLPGILHPVFFSEKRSPISQLARGGMITGHEFWHSVDNIGSMYDNEGNIGYDWQPNDLKVWLAEKEACFLAQIREYRTPMGTMLDAEAVLGEVMADVWGANSALRAATELMGRELTQIEVREFIEALGQTWCAAIDEVEERERAAYDVHPPPSARIDLVVRNLVLPGGKHAMSYAYGCSKTSSARPSTLCTV